jgi:hypothetical protein
MQWPGWTIARENNFFFCHDFYLLFFAGMMDLYAFEYTVESDKKQNDPPFLAEKWRAESLLKK